MSAETLRKAAALMRERAGAARAGRWFADRNMVRARWASGPRDVLICDASLPEGNRANAAHVAGMDPAVALAVADWLDATARELDSLGDPDLSGHPLDGRRTAGIAVARAYLGESS